MLENENSSSSMLEHEKILLDRAFARVFDWKCTIFAKICLFSKARLHRALKDRASSMLEHQKLTSDGHFSGSSMLGCNTSFFPLFSDILCHQHVMFNFLHHIMSKIKIHLMWWTRYVRYSHEIQPSPSRLMNWSHDVVLALLEHYIQNILDTAVSDYTSVFW